MNLQRNFILLGSTLLLALITSISQAAEPQKKSKNQAARKASAPLVSPLPKTTNSIGITMVTIPAGEFLMGSCKATSGMAEENKKRAFLGQAPLNINCKNIDQNADDIETPQHSVAIEAFQLGKTEVTLRQFKQFIAATGNTQLVTDDFIQYNNSGDDAPVVAVSWYDTQAFLIG